MWILGKIVKIIITNKSTKLKHLKLIFKMIILGFITRVKLTIKQRIYNNKQEFLISFYYICISIVVFIP